MTRWNYLKWKSFHCLSNQQTWQFLLCKFHLKVARLWIVRYLHGVPDFPKVCVPQCCLCSDAFIRVVGEHLIEQRQSWSGAARDQPWDTGAFFRGEVEMHCSRPARHERKMRSLVFYAHTVKIRSSQFSFYNKRQHIWGGTPTAWTSGGRFDLVSPTHRGSWKPGPTHWFQEREDSNWNTGVYNNLTAATTLFTQHLFDICLRLWWQMGLLKYKWVKLNADIVILHVIKYNKSCLMKPWTVVLFRYYRWKCHALLLQRYLMISKKTQPALHMSILKL